MIFVIKSRSGTTCEFTPSEQKAIAEAALAEARKQAGNYPVTAHVIELDEKTVAR